MEDTNYSENPAQIPQPAPVQTTPTEKVNFSLDFYDMKKLSGWASFTAVMNIIYGSITCLFFFLSIFTIVGIFFLAIPTAVAVIQIIAGAQLFGAAGRIKSLVSANDYNELPEVFSKLKKYFTLNGIALIINLVLAVIGIIIFVIIVAVVASNYDQFNNYKYNDWQHFFESLEFFFR